MCVCVACRNGGSPGRMIPERRQRNACREFEGPAEGQGPLPGGAAARLHVVRQTVSKWEKGRSVPDADLLIRLAEELDTTSAALLGPEVPPEAERGGTAEQLARIAEQLAVKNRRARRIWRIVAGVLIAFVMVNLLLILLSFAAFRSFQAEAESTVQAQELPRGES